MGSVKLNISMDAEAVKTLRRRASESGKPMGRFLADLVEEEARRAQDALADEGYRVLAMETRVFAERAWPLAQETWPAWEKDDAEAKEG